MSISRVELIAFIILDESRRAWFHGFTRVSREYTVTCYFCRILSLPFEIAVCHAHIYITASPQQGEKLKIKLELSPASMEIISRGTIARKFRPAMS